MSKIIDFANPTESELTEQDKLFLTWLENIPQDETSTEMFKAMKEVDDDLFKGVF